MEILRFLQKVPQKSKPDNWIQIMAKDCNIVGLTIQRDLFFRFWVELLKPMTKLADKESDIFAAFLQQRYELSRVISDESLLDEILMGNDSRQKIREKFNMSSSYLNVVIGILKKRNLIVDGKINKKYVPDLTPDFNSFRLIFAIDINENKGEI